MAPWPNRSTTLEEGGEDSPLMANSFELVRMKACPSLDHLRYLAYSWRIDRRGWDEMGGGRKGHR